MELVRNARRRLGVTAAVTAALFTAVTGSCRSGSPADRGGAATGDDFGEESGTPGAGSATSNDSFLQHVPPARDQRPAHDETGRDTVGT
jgi:hypothetical protein